MRIKSARYLPCGQGVALRVHPTFACGEIGGVRRAIASQAGAALRRTLEPIRAPFAFTKLFALMRRAVGLVPCTGHHARNEKSTPLGVLFSGVVTHPGAKSNS